MIVVEQDPVLLLRGRLVFKGTADIGPGSQLGISGDVICGDQFAITAYTLIASNNAITFGKNVMISWDVSVIDHDWHEICDKNGAVLNPAKPVCIGDDVWICCKAMILKGSKIQDGVIVAAGTTVSGSIDATNAIIGSDLRVRVLKEGVFWKR